MISIYLYYLLFLFKYNKSDVMENTRCLIKNINVVSKSKYIGRFKNTNVCFHIKCHFNWEISHTSSYFTLLGSSAGFKISTLGIFCWIKAMFRECFWLIQEPNEPINFYMKGYLILPCYAHKYAEQYHRCIL